MPALTSRTISPLRPALEFFQQAGVASEPAVRLARALTEFCNWQADPTSWSKTGWQAYQQQQTWLSQLPVNENELVQRFIEHFPASQIEIALLKFVLALNLNNCSKSTIRNYRSDINQFFTFCRTASVGKAITKNQIQNFERFQADNGLLASSIKRKTSSIQHFWQWCFQNDLVLSGPESSVEIAKEQVRQVSEAAVAIMAPQQPVTALVKIEEKPKALLKIPPTPVIALNSHQRTQPAALEEPRLPAFLTGKSNQKTSHTPAVKIVNLEDTRVTKKPAPVSPIKPVKAAKSSQPKPKRQHQPFFSGIKNVFIGVTQFLNNVQGWVTYLNLAVLLLFILGISVLGYQQFFSTVNTPLAYPSTPVNPSRILSFQGRLTDTAQNPVTSSTAMIFSVYNHVTNGAYSDTPGSAGPLLWQGSCSVIPDQDGIFNVNLGDGTCGSAVNDYVFSENQSTYLEIRVGSETLTPRQPLRSVAYALNAGTLQGYPLSATGAATVNTILFMDGGGSVVLGETNPEIRSISGTFTLEGRSMLLQTASGSNGDIVLNADGLGGVVSRDYVSAPGATISATYAGGVPLAVQGGPSGTANILNLNNNSGSTLAYFDASGNLVTGGTVGIAADTDLLSLATNALTVNGTITATGNINSSGGSLLTGGTARVDNSGNLTNIGTTQFNTITYTWPASQTTGYVLSTNGSGALSWVPAGTGDSYWVGNNGAIYPTNSTVDVLFGGQASSSANFAFINNSGSGTPTASISGNLTLNSAGQIQSTRNQTLTIGGDSTGDIILSPRNNSGNVGINTTSATHALTVRGPGVFYPSGVTPDTGYNGSLRVTQAAASGQYINLVRQSNYAWSLGMVYNTSNFAIGAGAATDSNFSSPFFVIENTSGDVGIGSTAPVADLDVVGAFFLRNAAGAAGSNYGVEFNTSSSLPRVDFVHNGSYVGQFSSNATSVIFKNNLNNTGNILFQTNTNNVETTRATITNGGNWGLGTTTPIAKLQVTGIPAQASNALVILNTTGSNDILTASTSGTTRLTLSNAGDLQLYGQQDLRLADSDSTNYAAIQAPATIGTNFTLTLPDTDGDSGQVLSTDGSGVLSWTGVATLSNIFWYQGNGALYPANSTVDLLVGGQSTASARFAVTNVNGGATTATISGTTTGYALSLNGDGTIATSLNRSLFLNPTGGRVGIGTTTATALLDVAGIASSSGTLTFRGTTDPKIDILNGEYLAIRTSPGGDSGLTERVSFLNNGQVGIGTTSPFAKLSFGDGTANSVTSRLAISESSAGQYFYGLALAGSGGNEGLGLWGGTEATVPYNGSSGTQPHVFIERSTGYLGVGTTNPADSVHVYGSDRGFISENSSGGNFARLFAGSSAGVFFFNDNNEFWIRGASSTTDAGGTGLINVRIYGNDNANANDISLNNGQLYLDQSGGNVSVGGDTSPNALFSVGTTSQFQVNSSGIIAAIDGVAHTIEDVGGNLRFSANSSTIEFTDNIQMLSQTDIQFVDSDNTNNAAIQAPTNIGTNYTLTLPDTDGDSGQALTTDGSGVLSWGSYAPLSSIFWYQGSGALYPANSTVDVLFGGQASSSANFAFINNSGSGTPTASISGNLTLNSAGALQTTQNRSLTIGGNSTGNITLNPGNGSGLVQIGNSNATLSLEGGSSLMLDTSGDIYFDADGADFRFNDNGTSIFTLSATGTDLTLYISGNDLILNNDVVLNIGGSGTDVAYNAIGDSLAGATANVNSDDDLYIEGNLEVEGTTVFGNVAYTWPSGDGGSGQVLSTNGSGTLSWTSAASISNILWYQGTGALYPANSTVDLLVGGQSTASARFAVTNVNGGATTATISGTTAGFALSLNGDGTIATSLNRSLLLNPSGGNVGIGTTTATSKLDIFSAAANSDVQRWMATDGSRLGRFTETSGGAGWFEVDNATGVAQALFRGDGGASYLLTGPFGIGTSSPATNARLTLANTLNSITGATGDLLHLVSDAPAIRFGENASNTQAGISADNGSLRLMSGATRDLSFGTDLADNAAISSGGTVQMTIQNTTGNIGMGTTSPLADLHLTGNYGSNAALIIDQLNSGDIMAASVSGVTRYRIDTNGYSIAQRFSDISNEAFYLDPAATGIALNIAGDLIVGDAGILNIGGNGSTINYNAFADSTAGASALMTSDSDVYIQGDLEVDGGIQPGFTTGSIAFQGASGLTQDNTGLFWDDSSNFLGIGTSAPGYRLEIRPASGDPNFALGDADVAHGVTGQATTTSVLHVAPISSTDGGAQISAFADQVAGAQALEIRGITGSTNPTDTIPMIRLTGARRSGTGIVDLAAAETVFQVRNNDNAADITLLGNGDLGLGTTVPGYSLHLEKATSRATMMFRTFAAGDPYAEFHLSNYDNGQSNIIFSHNNGSSELGNLWQLTSADDTDTFNFHNWTLDAPTMRFDNASNRVLFGNNTSSYLGLLHLETRGTNVPAFGKAVLSINQIETNGDLFTASASGTTRFVITNSGGFGLNTPSAANLLGSVDVRGHSSTLPIATFSGSTSGIGLRVENNGSGDIFRAGVSGRHVFSIKNNGEVSIGTVQGGTTRLYVTGEGAAPFGATTASFGTNAMGTFEVMNAYSTNDVGTANEYFMLFRTDEDGTPDNEYRIETNGQAYADGAWNGGGADVAEMYKVLGNAEEGDLVAITNGVVDQPGKTLAKSTGYGYDTSVVGVISTDPGLVAGWGDTEGGEAHGTQPVALVGRVPVKVSLENGPIAAGDPLTSSNQPGVAMKATRAGRIIGYALEAYDGTQSRSAGTIKVEQERLAGSSERQPLPAPQAGTGKIMVFVNTSYHDPAIRITSTGDVTITGNDSAPIATATYTGSVAGQLLTKVDAFADLAVANLKAGIIRTRQLLAEVRIQTPEVKTTLISPIDDTVAVQLSDANDTFQVTNAQQQPVVTIDDQGNTSLLGQLTAATASVSGDATVSGQLDATSARIQTLEAKVAEFEAIKAQTAELVNATVSGTLYADNINGFEDKVATAIQKPSLLAQILGTPDDASTAASVASLFSVIDQAGYTATGSALLNKSLEELNLASTDVSLGADAAFINTYFEVNGPAYFANSVGIANELWLGNGTRISDGSIEYVNPTDPDNTLFAIQPSGKGTLSLMAGVLTVKGNGQVVVTGDLRVAGNVEVEESLLTDMIKPADFGNPLQVQVAGVATESGQVQESRFEIVNELGTPVATISAQGKATFAGGLGIGSENVAASGSAQVDASKTSGKAVVSAGNSEVTIRTNKVGPDSLIYVTPQGSTGNQVLYVKSQTADNPATSENEGQFVVGFDSTSSSTVLFSWWIVN